MAVKPQTIGITENTNTIPSAEQRNSKPLTFILKSKAENNSSSDNEKATEQLLQNEKGYHFYLKLK